MKILTLCVLLSIMQVAHLLIDIGLRNYYLLLAAKWAISKEKTDARDLIDKLANIDSFMVAGVISLNDGRLDEAYRFLDKAEKKKEKHILSNYWLGMALYQECKYDGAIEVWKHGLPDQIAAVLLHKAKRTQNIQERERISSLSIELNPQVSDAYFQLGKAQAMQDKFSSALVNYAKALDLEVESQKRALIAKEMGSAYRHLNNHEAALTFFNQAIIDNPEDSDGYILIGDEFAFLSDFGCSYQNYVKAIETDPGNSSAYIKIGNLYSGQGNIEVAREWFLRGIAENPNDPAGYYEMGKLMLGQGQPIEAIDYFNRSIELGLNHWWVLSWLGSAYEASGEFDQAILTYNKVVESEGITQYSYYSLKALARLYTRIGNPAEASISWDLVLEIDPNDREAIENLGQSH